WLHDSAARVPALRSCAPKSECAARRVELRRLRGVRCHSSRSHPCRSDPRSPPPCGSCWTRPTLKGSVRGLARERATGGRKCWSPERSHQRRGGCGDLVVWSSCKFLLGAQLLRREDG